MSLWAVLEPLSSTVDAGGRATVALRVRNTGDIVEEYHVDVVGDPALWCTIEPTAVRLYPGTTATVHLTFAPPRSPDSAAGPHPFGVRVTPVESPESVMVPEGNLTVTPFVDVRAEMLPATVRGWRRAKPRLIVDNYGNTTATAAVLGDNSAGTRLDYDIREPAIQIPPGRAKFSPLRLRPERTLWLGQKVSHPYATTLQLSGAENVSANGTFLQTALLPRWVSRLFMLLLALAMVLGALWFSIHPSVASSTTAEPSPVSSATISVAPTSASPSTPPTTPSTAPATTTQAAVVAPSTSATVSVPAPTSLWKFDDGQGPTANDTEGKNPAALTNVSWCQNQPTNCGVFNGTNSVATAANNSLDTSAGNSFTVACWVYLNTYSTTNAGFETMVSQQANVNSGFYLQFTGQANNDEWSFSRVGADQTNVPHYRATSFAAAQANTWTFLVGTFNSENNTLTLYVNGVQQSTIPDPTPYASGGSLVMGRAQSNGGDYDWFSGDLRGVAVYGDTALSPAQVNKIYTDGYGQ